MSGEYSYFRRGQIGPAVVIGSYDFTRRQLQNRSHVRSRENCDLHSEYATLDCASSLYSSQWYSGFHVGIAAI